MPQKLAENPFFFMLLLIIIVGKYLQIVKMIKMGKFHYLQRINFAGLQLQILPLLRWKLKWKWVSILGFSS